MTKLGHEKSALHTAQLDGKDSEKDASTSTQHGAQDMPEPITLPARFRQEHEGDDAIFLANEHSGPWVDAEEMILPHNGTGLTPLFNLQVGVIEGTLPEIREAITEALDWLHRIEAQLPGGTETN